MRLVAGPCYLGGVVPRGGLTSPAFGEGGCALMAQEVQWKRDGWEATVRIGVLTPHADVNPESELQVRAFAEPPHLDNAAELLAAAPLKAIVYGFTASAYVIGMEGEDEMIARLERRTRGIPVVATCKGAVEGLRVLGARRIALLDPPWFDTELNALGRRYYESAGFEVVYSAPCGLPSSQAKITPADLHAWVSEHVSTTDAEAIVFGGNGFRVVGVISALEEDLGRAVVTPNQALLWAALRVADADVGSVRDYGRLFGYG